MRFNAAIFTALTVISIGVQAAPAPQETTPALESVITTSISIPISTDSPTTVPLTPVPSPSVSSTSVDVQKPTGKIEPPPAPKPVVKEPEYELVCKDVAFFHNWDIYWADLPSGPTNGTCIYDCAKDLVKDKEADATVAFDGFCYPKSLEHVQAYDFFKNKGRDLAIEGCCEDLKEDNKHKKCYPEKLLDCCYDRKICVKVLKKPKCDSCHKKDDKKEEEKKY
ncbi:hypothetical protein QFC20_004452 [Naganishia adeliensis]|uniref:Uncharacterized protein n=1 Tax=Naganishia adeliensis TaxID=92952 RepID=A0ACC2W2B8_9TREE|nr:hypothetical protein QFC20_004452 [Naganishia adeliensis]